MESGSLPLPDSRLSALERQMAEMTQAIGGLRELLQGQQQAGNTVSQEERLPGPVRLQIRSNYGPALEEESVPGDESQQGSHRSGNHSGLRPEFPQPSRGDLGEAERPQDQDRLGGGIGMNVGARAHHGFQQATLLRLLGTSWGC